MSGPFTEEKMSLILILPAPDRIRQAGQADGNTHAPSLALHGRRSMTTVQAASRYCGAARGPGEGTIRIVGGVCRPIRLEGIVSSPAREMKHAL